MNTPFSLNIFVADGDPAGLRIIENMNWRGKALLFPRAAYPRVKLRKECELPGVYLLLGPTDSGDGEQLYIGEGDPVKPRLDSHFAKKEFWTHAIFFTAEDALDKAHVQYLESRLVVEALAANRVKLENGNAPSESTLSESARANMEIFLTHLLELLPVIGVTAFVRPQPTIARQESLHSAIQGDRDQDTHIGRPLLTCKVKGLVATGYDSTEGFVVLAGSDAVATPSEALRKNYPGVEKERQSLISRGVLKQDGGKLKFTQDYAFSSPSMASSALLGRAANGRTNWKDASGRTLKELQTEQTASSK